MGLTAFQLDGLMELALPYRFPEYASGAGIPYAAVSGAEDIDEALRESIAWRV